MPVSVSQGKFHSIIRYALMHNIALLHTEMGQDEEIAFTLDEVNLLLLITDERDTEINFSFF